MNIFYLHNDTKTCAELHVDKHVVKMIVEYAQLLSTAKRMTDGIKYEAKSKTGRKVQRYRLENPNEEATIYKAVHYHHPSAVWARSSTQYPPTNLKDNGWSEPPPAMSHYPQCIVPGDSIQSYKNYYIEAKAYFAKWTNRETPEWFESNIT